MNDVTNSNGICFIHKSSAKLPISSPAHLALGEGVPGVGADAGLAVPLAARQVHQVQLGLADVLPAQGVVVDNLQMYIDDKISLDYHL